MSPRGTVVSRSASPTWPRRICRSSTSRTTRGCGTYQHDHTKLWSEKVAAADAIVFVIPEYNYGIGAALQNALDYLHAEWAYKPASVVSYGGVSAGTRSAMALQGSAYALNLFILRDAVNIPFVRNFFADGVITPNETMTNAATTMLDELSKVATALAPLRAK